MLENNKREKYISWRDYFASLAYITSLRSKDPNTQVGCCIFNPETHRVVSLGYNGFPNDCSDDEFPWTKTSKNDDENKYFYVVHAELNAILNAKRDISGCYMMVTLFPCRECTKAIIQSGISKVFYLNEPKKLYDPDKLAAMKMLNAAGIELERINDFTKEDLIHLIQ